MTQLSRRRPGSLASWAAVVGLWGAASPAAAQAPVPLGTQFQLNTYTTGPQSDPSVAAAANGDFVVVWRSSNSSGTDTSSFSIQAQRFASDGSSLGAQFQVNTYTTYDQGFPSVSAAPDGDFVVGWISRGSLGTDTSVTSIQAQRYASDGSAQGPEFQVNTYTTSGQGYLSVATAPDGDFIVTWQSRGSFGTDTDERSIQAQRYASDGTAQGAEFQVNNYTTGTQKAPSVAASSDGGFVIVWHSYGSPGTDSSDYSIQGQRFASDGSAMGPQFQVNSYTTSYQYYPAVAADADGDFVVVWTSRGSLGTDTAFESVQGQRYASDGSAQGAQFQLNSYTTSDQAWVSVAAAAGGDFVVVWQSIGSSGSDTSYRSAQGQRYASDGSAQGPEFQVNTYTTANQLLPSVAMTVGRNFVVAWQSVGSFGTDTSVDSIQGQRYAAPSPAVPALSPSMGLALGIMLLLLGAIMARTAR